MYNRRKTAQGQAVVETERQGLQSREPHQRAAQEDELQEATSSSSNAAIVETRTDSQTMPATNTNVFSLIPTEALGAAHY